MNTRQVATQIARRLPDLRKRDVQEVLDLLTELWREELAKPNGEIHISGLGTLYVETHTLRATGIVRRMLMRKYGRLAPTTIQRRTVRFRPYDALRAVVIAAQEERHE